MSFLQLATPYGVVKALDLPTIFGGDLARLPFVHRILLENVAREDADRLPSMITVLRGWLVSGTSEAEIAFHPSRVLMHDTTCVPALVDIAAMRDAIAEAGGDPASLTPVLPVDVSVDHSIGVDMYGQPQSRAFNMQREMERNSERYRLMKWATTALPGVTVHPPGTGIMHTLNLEQLATVIRLEDRNGETWATPDTLIGTDSHTPMINGIGVLGWGVGGLEAESVFFGFPVTIRLPDVVGVRLTGRLSPGVLSTDLALDVTHLLRRHAVSGEFVEFFGPGVATLSGGDRAVIANMAPEYGASTGYFPIDSQTIEYLRGTGRACEHCSLVESAARAMGLWFDPEAEPRYTRVIELDLGNVCALMAGPQRPQDKLALTEAASALEAAVGRPLGEGSKGIPDGAIAIAAITSCTNTSDQRLLAAAGLAARKANRLGLRPPWWVKTSLAPGSPSAELFLKRSGLLVDLEAIGFGIVGHGCTTCIGNSGPLQPDMAEAIANGTVAAALLSGNRNFPGRIHPSLQFGFLASPPHVVALSIIGKFCSHPMNLEIAKASDDSAVHLCDLLPSDEEIDAILRDFSDNEDFGRAFHDAAQNEAWLALEAPSSPTFPWDESSTYIRRPPFAGISSTNRLGTYSAHPLLVLGDDMTTDHISPAGQIVAESYAGRHLVAAGDQPNDLNVYAARRGNWQAMVRGLFDNRTAANLLLGGEPASRTVHAPSMEEGPLWEVAQRYRQEGRSVVIVAGERYGAGSSRDWAAKGVALLSVRAVIARSFERIHRTNLIGMGILPIAIESLLPSLSAQDLIEIDATRIHPRCDVRLVLQRASGAQEILTARAAVETEQEAKTMLAGGMIPLILNPLLAGTRDLATNGSSEGHIG
ncbi:aconitate hydratase [Sinorhizobium terangae]|uniref:Aconitate hydratase A n=1 Tax=Sinorhizobium terangae TaxID=110322 RepID=A0A6N7LJU3_SINTE|nr:aconitate hydratase AcnA [Sinorhizobium terangae]MBB4188462.1 aconitate hydratase [Sinorhizobium terangae]MQX18072.1 aconitate hydratase AcnA [Sinorhizobium terangae]